MAFQVGDLGPFLIAETAPGRHEGTFLLPERLGAAPAQFTLTAPDGTTATTSSPGKLSVTGTDPRMAEVTAFRFSPRSTSRAVSRLTRA